jgi:hypothetical protein
MITANYNTLVSFGEFNSFPTHSKKQDVYFFLIWGAGKKTPKTHKLTKRDSKEKRVIHLVESITMRLLIAPWGARGESNEW